MSDTNQINKGKLLVITNLNLSFGGIQALSDVSLDIQRGEIVAIIGPNGAGKTCLLNCVSGFYRPSKGEIYLNGLQIARMRPDKIVRLGIVRTFQHDELFTELSTLDNLLMARHKYSKCGLLRTAFYFRWAKSDEMNNLKAADEHMNYLELQTFRNRTVKSLPYGIQKKVGVARALMMQPQLLLLDEPMSGMTIKEKEEMIRMLLKINQLGVTMALVEHDMRVVMGLAKKLIVLNFGQKIAEGEPQNIVNNPDVIKAYIGEVEAFGT